MYELTKSFAFEAAHKLPNHDGQCRRLHGHSFKMVLTLRGKELIDIGAKEGMLVDYSDITRVVKPILDQYLDHHYLNESTGLDNPTSEALAEWIYNRLAPVLCSLRNRTSEKVKLVSVRVEETCTCACTYYPDKAT